MNTNFQIRIAATVMICGLFFLQSCRKDDETAMVNDATSVASQDQAKVKENESSAILRPWYDLLLVLVKSTPGHTPPIVAREMGYTGITLYEATTGGVNGYKTLAGQIQGLNALPQSDKKQDYIGPVAANAALARIISSLYGNASAANVALINNLETTNDASFVGLYDNDDIMRSRQFGRDIADAIYLYSQSDGGHLAYLNPFPTTYIPPVGPGLWVPTPPAFAPKPMLPYWGSNRTFVAENSYSPINPPLPPTYSTATNSALFLAAQQVYNTSVNLTQSQKDIADYWADGGGNHDQLGNFTPPGHLIAITVQLLSNKDLNMHKAAALLAKEGITLNDAAIVCWRAKFANNMERPVTYIRDNINSTWLSYIKTPPFPTYTSGHSSFSGGTAHILEKEFGKNKSFTDSTKVILGFAPRTFNSFSEAAQEAAVSRLYGGIHYEMDNVFGFNCGDDIANNVLKEIHWK